MNLREIKKRRYFSLILEAVMIIFILSYSVHGAKAAPATEKSDAVQTEIASSIPFNLPSERPQESLLDKFQPAVSSFTSEKIIDTPGQETVNNPAILINSYQHNVFYVLLTAKAP